MEKPDQLAYSIPEFVKAVGISRAQLYKEMEAGNLTPAKVGRRTLIPTGEAQRWLKSKMDPATN